MIESGTIKKKKTYTDYVRTTPEGWGFELFDGNIRDMAPAPYTKHQRAAGILFTTISALAEKKNLGVVYIAPTDVYFDEHNCVQPDILFISKERKHIITEKNIQSAPDWIIEIVSPHHRQHDTVEKKELYECFGVKEFWLVFPDEEIIAVYLLKDEKYILQETFKDEQTLHSATLGSLNIATKKVFIR